MARIEESVDIRRPAERVFAFTTDAGSWPKWQSIIPRSQQTSPGPVAVGTTFQGVTRLLGLSMKWTAKATEYEPSKRYAKNITSAGMFIEQHNTYAPIEGGMRFSLTYDLRVRGIFKLFSPMLIGAMRRELKKSLGNLKGILETQN